MQLVKKTTIQLATVTAVTAILTQHDRNLLYTEHQFSNGQFDATLKNSEGQEIKEPVLFTMAKNAVSAAPENVS